MYVPIYYYVPIRGYGSESIKIDQQVTDRTCHVLEALICRYTVHCSDYVPNMACPEDVIVRGRLSADHHQMAQYLGRSPARLGPGASDH